MPAQWDQLREEVLSVMRSELKDLWEKEDTEALKELAEDVAREKWRALTAKSVIETDIANQNLRLLAADLHAHAIIKRLQLTSRGKDFAVRALQIVIKTVAIPSLVAL
jgi:hypothetical protein